MTKLNELIGPLGYKLENGKLHEVKLSGRLIPKSLTSIQSKVDWPVFCAEYLAEYPVPIQVAYGDDIHDIFENYRPGSCMAPRCKRELREVYANNPKQVCCVYATQDSHELLTSNCSALLWLGAEQNYLDRVYSSGWVFAGAIEHFFRSIETTTGKHLVSLYHDTVLYPRYRKRVTFKLRHCDRDPLPYMDSINIITDYSDDYVELSTDGSGEVCRDTNGTIPNGEGNYRCESCNCRLHEDDMRMSEHGDCYCDDCYAEAYCYVSARINGRWHEGEYSWDDVCEIDNEYYPKDECVELHNGDYALSEDAVELHNGDYALSEDVVELHNGDYALSEDAVELHNGDYALSEDAVELCDDIYNPGRFALASDCLTTDNGAYIVSDVCFFSLQVA